MAKTFDRRTANLALSAVLSINLAAAQSAPRGTITSPTGSSTAVNSLARDIPTAEARAKFVTLGAKASSIINWNSDPVDSNGVPWYSPSFDDSAWRADDVDQSNTVPAGKSKLWRVYIRVDALPSPGAEVLIRAYADDALTIWMDGYKLGKFGTTAAGGPMAGGVSVDIANRFTTGNHIVALRLDNGPESSRLRFKVRDMSPDSPDALAVNGLYWLTLRGDDDEAEERRLIGIARKGARERPRDMELRQMALHSYLLDAPRDLQDAAMARRELENMQSLGLKVSLEDEYCVALAGGRLDAFVISTRERKDDPAVKGVAPYFLGQAHFHLGDRSEAVAEFGKVLAPPVRNTWLLNQQLTACDRLLDLGVVEAVSRQVPLLLGPVEKQSDSQLLGRLAAVYERLGDRTTSGRLRNRQEQTGDSADAAAAAYRRIERAYVQGEFDMCLVLLDAAMARPDISNAMQLEKYAYFRARILAELGRPMEARDVAAKLASIPDSESSLLRRLELACALEDVVGCRELQLRLQTCIEDTKATVPYYRPDSSSLVVQAKALRMIGDVAGARTMAQEILKATPDSPLREHQWQRAWAMLAAGDAKNACALFARASSLDPDNYWVRRDLARATGETGRTPAAGDP